MRTRPGLGAVVVAADQVRGHGEPLEVLRLERRLPIRRRQLGEGSAHARRAKDSRPRSSASAVVTPLPPTTRRAQGPHEARPESLSVARHESILCPPRRCSRRSDATLARQRSGRAGRGIRHCDCLRVSLAHERRQTGSASRDARNGRRQARRSSLSATAAALSSRTNTSSGRYATRGDRRLSVDYRRPTGREYSPPPDEEQRRYSAGLDSCSWMQSGSEVGKDVLFDGRGERR